MEKQFGELSQFLQNKRDVELFRSSDMENTATYFTDIDNDKEQKVNPFFELLRFGLEGGDHQVYVRFPNSEYFVEMLDGGMGSSHGNMMTANGKNVWGRFEKEFTIHSHDTNLILVLDDIKFNFMKKVASYDKGNPFDRPYPNETFVNYEEIEKALSLKFLKLPENIRNIQYMFKTLGTELKYIVVDCPAYNFKYDNHRFRVIENGTEVKEHLIKSFQRYRDGGTTIIKIIDENGVEHTLFSPQKMFPTEKKLVPKYDDVELVEIEKGFEYDRVVELLKIELEPVEANDDNDNDNSNIELDLN